MPTAPKKITIPFKPRPWQQEILNSTAQRRVMVASRGGGKTHLGLYMLLMSQHKDVRKFNAAHFLSVSRDQAIDNGWHRMIQITKDIGRPEKTRGIIHLTKGPFRGGRIVFGGATARQRGQRSDFVLLDEAQLCSQYIFATCVAPLIEGDDYEQSGRIVITGTPQGKGFMYDCRRKGLDPAYKNWEYFEAGPDVLGIPKEKLDEYLDDLGETAFQQEIMLNWDISADHHVYADILGDLDEQGRMVDGGLYNPDLPVVAGLDLGVTAPTCVWYAQFPYRDLSRINLIKYEEYFDMTQEEIIHQMRQNPFEVSHVLLPHDAAGARGRSYTASKEDTASTHKREWGFANVSVIKKTNNITSDILTSKKLMKRCAFDRAGCEAGIVHLTDYHTFKKDDLVTDDIPKQKARDCADAFRTLATGITDRIAAKRLSSLQMYHTEEADIESIIPTASTSPFII